MPSKQVVEEQKKTEPEDPRTAGGEEIDFIACVKVVPIPQAVLINPPSLGIEIPKKVSLRVNLLVFLLLGGCQLHCQLDSWAVEP